MSLGRVLGVPLKKAAARKEAAAAEEVYFPFSVHNVAPPLTRVHLGRAVGRGVPGPRGHVFGGGAACALGRVRSRQDCLRRSSCSRRRLEGQGGWEGRGGREERLRAALWQRAGRWVVAMVVACLSTAL